jgi:hypothetical protein
MINKKMESSRQIFLFCGYRGWGKNTAANHLQKIDTSFEYDVYARDPTHTLHLMTSDPIELSFARVLKEEVGALLNLTWTQVDAQKERLLNPEEMTLIEGGPFTTVRDLLIASAAHHRADDPQFYVRYLLDNGCTDQSKEYIIPDWRYKNEIEFIRSLKRPVVTVRVLRSGIQVPPPLVESEHDLDDVETDFILTPAGDNILVPDAYRPHRKRWVP